MIDDKERLASKNLGETVSDGFRLFGQNYKKLILPFAVFYILSIVINVFVLTDLRWYGAILSRQADAIIKIYSNNPNDITRGEYNLIIQSFLISVLISFLDSLIGAIFTVIAICSVSSYIYKKYIQIPSNFNLEFKKSFNARIIKPIIIIGVLVPLGWALFWIPGIIIFILFIFLIYTYNMEGLTNPISEARSITKGAILRIIVVFLISIIISGIINLIYSTIMVFVWPVSATTITSWYNPATRNFGMIILYELVYSVIEILFAPLFVCLLTPLFVSSKARKDLGLKFQFKSSKQQKYQPTIQKTSIDTKKGIFCSYCGYKIAALKKYCPNCGKSIDF